MRTWTIFIVFGVIVLGFFLYANLAKSSTASHPVVRTAKQFFDAVARKDAATVKKLTDPSTCTVDKAGNTFVSLKFGEVAPFAGAFVRSKAVQWRYDELSNLVLDEDTSPRVLESDNLATLQLTNGLQMYLRRQPGGNWVIFYISKEPSRRR